MRWINISTLWATDIYLGFYLEIGCVDQESYWCMLKRLLNNTISNVQYLSKTCL